MPGVPAVEEARVHQTVRCKIAAWTERQEFSFGHRLEETAGEIVLRIGSVPAEALDFTRLDSTGRKRALADFRAQRQVALVFYPAQFETDSCLRELRSLQKIVSELTKLDTVIPAVSDRTVEFNKHLCAKERLNFQVLSDPDHVVTKKYPVWNENDDRAERVTSLVDKEGILPRIERNVGALRLLEHDARSARGFRNATVRAFPPDRRRPMVAGRLARPQRRAFIFAGGLRP